MNVEFSESAETPEFDPPSKGLYRGSLRLSFLKAMDKVASDEMEEIVEKVLPLFLKLKFSAGTKFSYLRKRIGHFDKFEISDVLTRDLIEYINLCSQWGKKYNIESEWLLDALHERLEHLALAEQYFEYQLEFVKFNPLKQLLHDYSELKGNEELLFLRGSFISEIFEFLKFESEKFNSGQKLDLIFQFLADKDGAEVTKIEDNWKLKKVKELEANKKSLQEGAIALSYNYGFVLEQFDFPFKFEFRSWQFNEERKSRFREEVTRAVTDKLDTYLSEVEIYAEQNGYKKVAATKKRKGLTSFDRLCLFVLYQVKNLSPDDCLNEFQSIIGKEIEMNPQAVSKIVDDLSQQLGFRKRKSKTKRKK